jgi:hypothetical protein
MNTAPKTKMGQRGMRLLEMGAGRESVDMRERKS